MVIRSIKVRTVPWGWTYNHNLQQHCRDSAQAGIAVWYGSIEHSNLSECLFSLSPVATLLWQLPTLQVLKETAKRLRDSMQQQDLHLAKKEARWIDYKG